MSDTRLTQQHLRRHPEKLARFGIGPVRIWSGQWGAWWRKDGAGYTDDITQAGEFLTHDAWRHISGAGPEKRIDVVSIPRDKRPPSHIEALALTGQEFRVTYPFKRLTHTTWDGSSTEEWVPGFWVQNDGDHSVLVANGEGLMLLRVVSVHIMPTPFIPRVFYRRNWIDPDGREFGRNGLQVKGLAAFKALSSRYRYHYEVIEA